MCKKCITFNVLKIKLIQTFSMRKINKKSSNKAISNKIIVWK